LRIESTFQQKRTMIFTVDPSKTRVAPHLLNVGANVPSTPSP